MAGANKEWVLLKVFLAAFSLLFVVGFVSGLTDRADLAKSQIISSMRVVDRGNAIYLATRCHNSYSHVFDPTSRTIDANPSSIGRSSAIAMTLSVRTHKDVILAFVGGSTGALTLQGVARASAATSKGGRGLSKVLTTIFGAASGYLLGYWSGTYSSEGCDSAAVTEAVTDPNRWNEAGRAFFWLQVHEFGYADERFVIDPEPSRPTETSEGALMFNLMRHCNSSSALALISAVERVKRASLPTADDYRTLLEFDRARDLLSADEGYRDFIECSQARRPGCFTKDSCAVVQGIGTRIGP
jgi:hypothetical protein